MGMDHVLSVCKLVSFYLEYSLGLDVVEWPVSCSMSNRVWMHSKLLIAQLEHSYAKKYFTLKGRLIPKTKFIIECHTIYLGMFTF